MGKNAFTVFAPADLAFQKLERSEVENLSRPENKMQLSAIMNKHVVRGRFNYGDLAVKF
ncbi:fasciclin domain-containing protein [Segetibacter koreensis]|uniref:fasciclin domain-containing protein n=1 Tax=Segetibacter koreensis TaxID=398037 RepID=UPI000A0301B8